MKCKECGSTDLSFDRDCGEHWCDDCQDWVFEDSDRDSESRKDIGRVENAVFDRENRK